MTSGQLPISSSAVVVVVQWMHSCICGHCVTLALGLHAMLACNDGAVLTCMCTCCMCMHVVHVCISCMQWWRRECSAYFYGWMWPLRNSYCMVLQAHVQPTGNPHRVHSTGKPLNAEVRMMSLHINHELYT